MTQHGTGLLKETKPSPIPSMVEHVISHIAKEPLYKTINEGDVLVCMHCNKSANLVGVALSPREALDEMPHAKECVYVIAKQLTVVDSFWTVSV